MKKLFLMLGAVLALSGLTLAGTDPLQPWSRGFYQNAGTPGNGTNCVQTLTFGATITGGSFVLKYKGWKTAAITWSSTNATLVANIDAALEAIPSLAGGSSVTTAAGTITSGANGTVTITFTGNYAALLVPAITVDSNSLTGAAATLTCAITTPGVTADGRSSKKGDLCVDTTNGILYQNQGTSGTAPTWVKTSSE